MLRFLIYIMFAYFIWRLVRIFSRQLSQGKQSKGDEQEGIPPVLPLDRIQDAEFEDLTTEPPIDSQQPPDSNIK